MTALIDTWNYGRYVEDAIRSVLYQDFPRRDFEVLVIDDGSTDDTSERVRRFGNQVRYMYKPRGGQASALNLGFEEARGSLIMLLDADDVWMPGKIRLVVEAFEAHPDVGLVYHPFVAWETASNMEVSPPFLPVSGFIANDMNAAALYSPLPTSCIAVRKSALGHVAPVPDDLRLMADGYLSSALPFVAPVAALHERLTKYRIHGDNLFSFSARDPTRTQVNRACQQVLMRELTRWLTRQGYDLSTPSVRVQMKKHELFDRELEFALCHPGRLRFFRHLREQHALYSRAWSPRYTRFQAVVAVSALVLGYSPFQWLKWKYRGMRWLPRIRTAIVPRTRDEVMILGRSGQRAHDGLFRATSLPRHVPEDVRG